MKLIIYALLIAVLPQLFIYNDDVVTGKVVDASDGKPIAGVTVSWKGTSVATSTDQNGKFSIKKVRNSATLVFTTVGFEVRNLRIKNNDHLLVKMHQQQQKLEEVAVTALGIEPQVQGRVAGVNSQNNRLRGNASELNAIYSDQEYNTEDYSDIVENRFHTVSDEPLSTFSIDVDGASYSNARRFLNNQQLPPAGAVRIEEFINYFHYDYPQPNGDKPFSINTEMSDCPWSKQNKLVLIGLQGKKIPVNNLPASNLVFLIDVSGSMQDENKLPLVKSSIKLLIEQLREEDRISLVVYAGSAGLVLPSTSGAQKTTISDAIDALEAGGSTAGGAGIRLAYKVAKDNFLKEGNNRVILCTDGDFNVGVSSDAELVKIVEEERRSGVFLTVLGYGMGNYKDNKMQELANKGNGNHSYIDNINEAKKVLVNEFGGTLFTIAKDVKLQLEFNPAKVQAYRLIGYENRMLKKEDFNNDAKDAGEIGSGHTVTALYEIIPAGVKSDLIGKVDPLKYQKNKQVVYNGNDLMTVKFRYKDPAGEKSRLIEHVVTPGVATNTSDNFRFAAAVAEFGMLLVNSEFRQSASFEDVKALAQNALGTDHEGYRKEFITLVKTAEKLKK